MGLGSCPGGQSDLVFRKSECTASLQIKLFCSTAFHYNIGGKNQFLAGNTCLHGIVPSPHAGFSPGMMVSAHIPKVSALG